MRPIVLAIHGVGVHAAGGIAGSIEKALRTAGLEATVHELNWSRLVEHSAHGVRELYWFLDAISVDLASAAALSRPGRGSPLTTLGELLYAASRALVALCLTVLFLAPLATTLVLFPLVYFSSFTWGQFSWLLPLVRYLALACACSLALMLLAGGFESAVERRWEALLVAIRRLAILLLEPVFLILTIPFAVDWTGLVKIAVFVLLGPLALQILVLLLLASATGSLEELTFDPALLSLFAVSCVLLPLGVVWIRDSVKGPWFDGPVKVTLDIFRYLGNPQNRRRIQDGLDGLLATLPGPGGGGREVVLIGHSLGSIIALDSLLHSAAWKRDDEVDLVTLGSPLRRFFLSFFPRLLFPASTAAIAARAGRGLKSFRWLNVYRPFDYVGTSLGLTGARAGTDLTTRQWSRLVSAHSDYWSDLRVLDAVQGWRGRASVPAATLDDAEAASHAYVLPWRAEAPAALRALATITERRWWMLAACLSLLMLWHLVVAGCQRPRTLGSQAAILERSGRPVLATVTHHRETGTVADFDFHVHHFELAFPTRRGMVRVPIEVFESSGVAEPLSFDYRALARFVREDCRPTRDRRHFFERRIGIPCRRQGIALRYDPREPRTFMLPAFPPPASPWGIRGWLSMGWFSFVAACLIYAAVWAGASLFRLFLGVPRQAEGESRAENPGY